MDKLRLQFYRERKVKSLAGFKIENTVTIHKLINSKVRYDPFNMKTKGTKRHNAFSSLRLSYKNYKRGYKTFYEFNEQLKTNKYLSKYCKRF